MEKINVSGAKEIIYKHVCKGGLEVYIWPYDLSDEIDMMLNVRYGSLHTSFEVNNKMINVPCGIAHFLEHIKFNEKEGVTANDFYSKIGSYVNAYTTYEYTSYEVTCDKDAKTNLNHLLYYVFNPYFTKKLIEKEKGIIKEEAKSSLGNAYSKGYHKLLENLLVKSNRRNLITGTPEEVESITLEDIKNVYDNFYLPDNMFLVVTGNVNPDEIASICDSFFEEKNYPKFNAKIIKEIEPLTINKEEDEIKDIVNVPKVYMAYKFDIKSFNVNKIDLSICLRRILDINYGQTSELYDYLTNNQITTWIGANYIITDDNVLIIIEFESDKIDEAIKLVDDKMSNLKIDVESFNRKKKNSIASLILDYDDPRKVSYELNNDLIKYKRVLNDIKDIQENLSFEQAEEIMKLLNNKNKAIVKIISNE